MESVCKKALNSLWYENWCCILYSFCLLWQRIYCLWPGMLVSLLAEHASRKAYLLDGLALTVYVLPHWGRRCRSGLPSYPVTVYWYWTCQFWGLSHKVNAWVGSHKNAKCSNRCSDLARIWTACLPHWRWALLSLSHYGDEWPETSMSVVQLFVFVLCCLLVCFVVKCVFIKTSLTTKLSSFFVSGHTLLGM